MDLKIRLYESSTQIPDYRCGNRSVDTDYALVSYFIEKLALSQIRKVIFLVCN